MRMFWRWLLLVTLAGAALELFFIGRIALMAAVDPQSTAFQRSEIWRIATQEERWRWQQQWVPYEQMSDSLKRAVIASEDGDFIHHDGVEWEAIEKAWQKNARAEALAEQRAAKARPGRPAPDPAPRGRASDARRCDPSAAQAA